MKAKDFAYLTILAMLVLVLSYVFMWGCEIDKWFSELMKVLEK